jgi:hypothetical protein
MFEVGLSICALSSADWFRVFWTIKGAFVDTEMLETMSQVIGVAKQWYFTPLFFLTQA